MGVRRGTGGAPAGAGPAVGFPALPSGPDVALWLDSIILSVSSNQNDSKVEPPVGKCLK